MKKLFIIFGLSVLSGVFTQILAADVAGVWTGRVVFKTPKQGEQPRDLTLTLKTAGSNLTGTLGGVGTPEGNRDSAEILDGKVNGSAVSFFVATGAPDMPRIEFTGKQDGDNLTLTMSAKNPNTGQEWQFGNGMLKRAK